MRKVVLAILVTFGCLHTNVAAATQHKLGPAQHLVAMASTGIVDLKHSYPVAYKPYVSFTAKRAFKKLLVDHAELSVEHDKNLSIHTSVSAIRNNTRVAAYREYAVFSGMLEDQIGAKQAARSDTIEHGYTKGLIAPKQMQLFEKAGMIDGTWRSTSTK